MLRSPARLLLLGLLLCLSWILPGPGGSAAWAARDTNSYDGNIYALYAGNGSLVPPRNSLADSLAEHRVTVLGFYLDDSADSKRFAPVFNELQRLWLRSAELILVESDLVQNRGDAGPTDPAHYWKGSIPQVVVFDAQGQVVFDASGAINIDAINAALSLATGLKPQGEGTSNNNEFNELNSEITYSR